MGIDIMMSRHRLFEALRAEARRTNDEALIRRWNEHCSLVSRRMEARDRARKDNLFGLAETYLQLWGG